MSELTPLPMSNPGPRTGTKLHDHQKIGLSKLLFMENDYRSLYEALIRHDPSLKNLKYLDLSAFDHMWKDEGGHTWSNTFTDLAGSEELRPLQGKGMILADEMGTGKSLTILALIEATIEASNDWKSTPQADPQDPTYRLPKDYSMKDIYIDVIPKVNPLKQDKPKYWNTNSTSRSNHRNTTTTPPKSCATLIVCPLSVVGVWQDHIKNHWNGKWTTLGGNMHLMGSRKRPLLVHDHYANQSFGDMEAMCNASIIITSYDALRTGGKKKGVLEKMIFYRVILDEGQNTNTKIFSAVEKIHKRHIHVLTGTPIHNHIQDVYAYSRLFDLPCGLSDANLFKEICVRPATVKNPDTTNLRAWGKVFALRRLKEQLPLTALPPRELKIFWLDRKMLPEHFEGVEDRTTKPWIDGTHSSDVEADRAGFVSKIHAKVKKRSQPKYRPLTGKTSIKMKWFEFFLNTHVHEKIVVFHFFHSTRDQAKVVLRKAGYDTLLLQSETSKDGRIEVTNEFNNSEDSNLCLLSSIMVGGEGLSMTGGTACVFLDLWWNPFVHEQAMGRVHRLGQKNPVTIYVPVTKNSYEDGVWFKQDAKRGFTQRLFPNDPSGELDISEMPEELLEWLRIDKEPKADAEALPEEDEEEW